MCQDTDIIREIGNCLFKVKQERWKQENIYWCMWLEKCELELVKHAGSLDLQKLDGLSEELCSDVYISPIFHLEPLIKLTFGLLG